MTHHEDGPKSLPSGFGKDVRDTLNQFVGFADAKIAAVVAGDLAIVAVLLQTHPDPNSSFTFVLAAIAVGLFGVSAIVGAAAFFPYVPPPIGQRPRVWWARVPFVASLGRRLTDRNTNPIYFEGIRNYGQASQYLAALKELTPQGVEAAYAVENFRLSRVLHVKYSWLQVAIILFGLGLFLTGCSLLRRI